MKMKVKVIPNKGTGLLYTQTHTHYKNEISGCE